MADDDIILYHAPHARSTAALTLLEELGAPYQLRLINMKAKEQRGSEYLAINPMGKVPAIHHRGALVTEQVAIFIYLADLFAEAGLAPRLDDARRGPYLRWLVYFAACYEPALVDVALKRDPAPRTMCPYGDFDTMLATLMAQLSRAPYLLGEVPTAADILWGMALQWGTDFKIIPQHDVIVAYVQRLASRPAFAKVAALDLEWDALQEKAVREAP